MSIYQEVSRLALTQVNSIHAQELRAKKDPSEAEAGPKRRKIYHETPSRDFGSIVGGNIVPEEDLNTSRRISKPYWEEYFRSIPLSPIASLQGTVGQYRFQEETMITAPPKQTLGYAFQGGLKFFNAFHLSYRWSQDRFQWEIPGRKAKNRADMTTHSGALGFQIPIVGRFLKLGYLTLGVDFFLGDRTIRGQDPYKTPQLQLIPKDSQAPISDSKKKPPIQLKHLLNIGVTPQACVLYGAFCLAYEYSTDLITKNTKIYSEGIKKVHDTQNNHRFSSSHKFMFSLNLGSVVDYLWIRQWKKEPR